MPDALSAAIEMHRQGQLGAASQLYRSLLAGEGENAEALHLLGVLHHQQGQHARAIELIGRAVALRPNAFIFHANLAEAYRARGENERAVGCCLAALRLWPDYPEALCNLGAALQALGRPSEAVGHLRRALELRPDFAVAHNNLGIALRDLEEPDESLTHFRRAVELEPNFAPSRTNLGQLLLDRGEAEEALTHCREAARLAPDLAALHHNLGNVLRALERLVDARASYQEALRLEPDLAASHAHLGLLIRKEGPPADALPWLKRAVELEPGNATYWTWLAELHDELEDSAESLACWSRAVELDPERAGPRLALGWAYQDEGRFDEARAQFAEAIRLAPDLATGPFHMGGLHEELGDLEAAEAAFREALRLQPSYAMPHARIATLLRSRLPVADLDALRARLEDGELGETPRARLLFALGHALDARGDHDGAADCASRGNALVLGLHKGRRDYSPDEHGRFVDALVQTFDRAFFDRLASGGLPSRRPVFVFGLPRSGTTLIEQVLASHPRVHGAGELRLARRTYEAVPAALGRKGPTRDALPDLDPSNLRSLAERHLARLDEIDGGKAPRIIDKMPDNYLYLGLLAAMFPEATFIHCRRDLRDVAVSCWVTDFRSIRWANEQGQIAHRIGQYHRLMAHWRATLPVPFLDVDYEDVVADLEPASRRLVAACGLDWDASCLDFHENPRPVRTASVAQVRQPVYRRSVARWKNYERSLGPLFAALPPGLTESST